QRRGRRRLGEDPDRDRRQADSGADRRDLQHDDRRTDAGGGRELRRQARDRTGARLTGGEGQEPGGEPAARSKSPAGRQASAAERRTAPAERHRAPSPPRGAERRLTSGVERRWRSAPATRFANAVSVDPETIEAHALEAPAGAKSAD